MTDDEAVKRAAQLMLKGATMLDISCPQCSAPLYRLEGKIRCAHCNQEVKIVKDEAELTRLTKSSSAGQSETSRQSHAHIQFNEDGSSSLKQVVESKLAHLEQQLAESNSPAGIKEIAKAINELLTILERIN